MKTSLCLSLLLAGGSFLVGAAQAEEAELPKFASKPIKYASRYGGELLIGDRSSNQLTFWFHVNGANNHVCSMAGTATGEDQEHYAFVAGECKLTLITVGRAVVLSDRNNQCQAAGYCGSRASIDGAVFFQGHAR